MFVEYLKLRKKNQLWKDNPLNGKIEFLIIKIFLPKLHISNEEEKKIRNLIYSITDTAFCFTDIVQYLSKKAYFRFSGFIEQFEHANLSWMSQKSLWIYP